MEGWCFSSVGLWEKRGKQGIRTSEYIQRIFQCKFLKMPLKCVQPCLDAPNFGKKGGVMQMQISQSGLWKTGAHFTCDLDLLLPLKVPCPLPLRSMSSSGTTIWHMSSSPCPPTKTQDVILRFIYSVIQLRNYCLLYSLFCLFPQCFCWSGGQVWGACCKLWIKFALALEPYVCPQVSEWHPRKFVLSCTCPYAGRMGLHSAVGIAHGNSGEWVMY